MKLLLLLFPILIFSQVGINTTDPKYTFQVIGTISVTDLPTVESAEYLVVWIPNDDPTKNGQFGKIKLSSIIQNQNNCPEFVKAESNEYYVKFRSINAVNYPNVALTINGLNFTKSGYWIENGFHYYTWSNTSGQPLNINDFSVNFGSGVCNYKN